MRVGLVVVVCGLAGLVGCSSGSSGGGITAKPALTQAATPTFSMAAGGYTSTQTVAIADATAGATIYYTTDGSTPSVSSAAYSTPLRVSATETLSALAFASGYSGSAVGAAAYFIGQPPVANASGPYTGTIGLAVSFSGSTSSDPQGLTLTYAWNFGDSSTGMGVSPTHTYATAGKYTVSLMVTDSYGLSSNAATAQATIAPVPLPGPALTGVVTSGAQPVVGTHVHLLAAGTTGYGGVGLAASGSNASVPVLSAAETGSSDSVGAYVVTGSNGGFSLTGDYTCTSGQQLYLYAQGGNAGSGANSAVGMMAAIGSCPSSSAPAVFATVNEVSTVAAAYAMAGFATDATHVGSSGTALALTGIANAFANAANLETLGTGAALATTPAGNGTVPQAEINTLANILASCVNSNGTGSGCSTLFANAESGGTTGTVATDTATAAINIAHNPATGVSALYGLASGTPQFAGGLTGVPNDWTISLILTANSLNVPGAIAIDAAGDAWITNFQGNNLTKLSASGTILSGSAGFTGGGLLKEPNSVAIDDAGKAWVSGFYGAYEFSGTGAFIQYPQLYSGSSLNSVAVDGSGDAWFMDSNELSEVSNLGTLVPGANPYPGHGLDAASGAPIAIDGSGSAWVADFQGAVTVVSSAGSVLSGASGYAVGGCCANQGAIALDGAGNAWIANATTSKVYELSNSGTLLSGSSGYASGIIHTPDGLAIDGAGHVWILSGNYLGGVAELSSTGSILSGAVGYKNSYFYEPNAVALDGSGDLWAANPGGLAQGDSIVEFIGVSTPVITPIAAGLPATPTADGSSNLGTRP